MLAGLNRGSCLMAPVFIRSPKAWRLAIERSVSTLIFRATPPPDIGHATTTSSSCVGTFPLLHEQGQLQSPALQQPQPIAEQRISPVGHGVGSVQLGLFENAHLAVSKTGTCVLY